MSLRVIAVVIVLSWSVISCAGSGNNESTANTENVDEQSSTTVFTACTDPRPELCTREYNPVCAKLIDASKKTYATGCTACSDQKVSGYYPGACEP